MIENKEGGYRLFCKGASEIVLSYCKFYVDSEGAVKPLDAHKNNEIEDAINQFATDGILSLFFLSKNMRSPQDIN